eukprot:651896_1
MGESLQNAVKCGECMIICAILLSIAEALVISNISNTSCYYHDKTLPLPLFNFQMKYHEPTNTAYVFGGQTWDGMVTTYHDKIFKWDLSQTDDFFVEIVTTTPTPKFVGGGSVIIDGYIYFINMIEGAPTETTGTVHVFNISEESFINVVYPKPSNLSSGGCVVHNHTHIFMVGGKMVPQYKDSTFLQILDLSTRTWTSEKLSPPIFAALGWASQYCALVNDELYAFGGVVNNQVHIDDIYKYNIMTHEWIHLGKKHSVAAGSGGAVYYDPYIYIIGPGIPSRHIEVFDVNQQRIVEVQYMAGLNHYPCAIQNQLFIFSGLDVQICDLPLINTLNPTSDPSVHPTIQPTFLPTNDPSNNPTNTPSEATNNPTSDPTESPTSFPTKYPTITPTFPTSFPTATPTLATYSPTSVPTRHPNEDSISFLSLSALIWIKNGVKNGSIKMVAIVTMDTLIWTQHRHISVCIAKDVGIMKQELVGNVINVEHWKNQITAEQSVSFIIHGGCICWKQ